MICSITERRDQRPASETSSRANQSEYSPTARLQPPSKSMPSEPNSVGYPEEKSVQAIGQETERVLREHVVTGSGATPEAAPSTPYKQVQVAFAIDVSYSTEGGVLEQEKQATLKLGAHLEAPARDRAQILPWTSIALPPVGLSDIQSLRPMGGTNPTVLNTADPHQRILQQCSLWFLLTDGMIEQPTVREFAVGIGENGLHGKACVVILFGYRPYRPVQCNISVGQSVFALAPHCAFLFHDVSNGEVFVFQCKGCFRSLLPEENMEVILTPETTWDQLPRLSYDRLAELSIPKPRQIASNAVFLASGRVVNLEDMYGERLGQDVSDEILGNDDNLKSVLLAAQSRGKSREIEHWVSKQRMSKRATEYLDRPDIDGAASKLISRLLEATKADPRDPVLEKDLRKQLRDAHDRNLRWFMQSVRREQEKIRQRNTIVSDALERVKLNRKSPGSPIMMSPVSPRPGQSGPREQTSQAYADWGSHAHTKDIHVPPDPPRLSHRKLHLPIRKGTANGSGKLANFYPAQGSYSEHQGRAQDLTSRSSSSPSSPAYQSYNRTSPFFTNPDVSDLLYMKGYKLNSGPSSAPPFQGRCNLCEDDNSPLALLLKAKPDDYETEGGFPNPGSNCMIKYPFAMGNFPETDIISSFLCCEKCASFVSRIGTSPLDEAITGAIPLVPLSNEMNRDSVLKEVDATLVQRFDLQILDQIFLSILYTKLDKATRGSEVVSEMFIRALEWQCRNFLQHMTLPARISCCSTGLEEDEGVYEPLTTTLSSILSNIDMPWEEGPKRLLSYPNDGFVTLIKAALDLDIVGPSDSHVEKLIFQRLLFYLAEQHSALREKMGPESAKEELCSILAGNQGGLIPGRFSVELEGLEGTYLLESSAYDSFRRLKEMFGSVERKCGVAIRLFLQLMANVDWDGASDEDFFDMTRARYWSSMLFTAPWDLKEEDCHEILKKA